MMQKDPITGKRIIVSELQRRIEYISVTSFTEFPFLKRLVESCLEDEPGNRPVISEVVKCLKNASSDQQGDNIIDLFTTVTAQEQELKGLKQLQFASANNLDLVSELEKLKVYIYS